MSDDNTLTIEDAEALLRLGNIELAGDRMTFEEKPDGSASFTFSEKGNGRACGSCTLCCKLLPVVPLNKKAGQRCQHQRSAKGCAIYSTRPATCRHWSCRWVSDRTATEGMPRPDRCHYVIDIIPDHVELRNPAGEVRRISVVQVWVDPAFRNVYQRPELRAFMLRMAEQFHIATIVRWNSRDAVTVFAPPFDEDKHEWHEMRGNIEARGDTDPLKLLPEEMPE